MDTFEIFSPLMLAFLTSIPREVSSSSPLYFSPVAEAKGGRSLFGAYPAETNDRARKVGSKKHRVPSLKLIYVTIIFNNAKKVRTIREPSNGELSASCFLPKPHPRFSLTLFLVFLVFFFWYFSPILLPSPPPFFFFRLVSYFRRAKEGADGSSVNEPRQIYGSRAVLSRDFYASLV